MNQYYIMSHDELNQLTVTGDTLDQAIELAKQSDYNALMFFDEYSLDDCYVEEIEIN